MRINKWDWVIVLGTSAALIALGAWDLVDLYILSGFIASAIAAFFVNSLLK
jgi:hypothetical protein